MSEEIFSREGWTEQTVQRLLVNPAYAVPRANPELLNVPVAQEPEDWIELQAAVIEGSSPAEDQVDATEGAGLSRWLNTLLACLDGQLPADHPVSPAHAVDVDPFFCTDHPPLFDRETWKQAQVTTAAEQGLYTWLDELLQTFAGHFVVVDEDGVPHIHEPVEPPGLPADALEMWVLMKVRRALEAGALAEALEDAGLDRQQLIEMIDHETIDNETLARIGFHVQVAGLHDDNFDPPTFDYEQNIKFVWPARRNEPCPCGSGEKFKRCCGA